MIRGVPYDAEVEYLESTGTQWIDTGYAFNSATDKVELVFELLTTTPNYKWIFGAYDASKRLAIGSGDNAGRRTFGYNASTSYYSSTYYTNGAHIFLADSTGASIDGQNFFGFADFSTTSHIFLYTIPINPSVYCSNARIWSYKHYRNGVLIHDCIPVRFTNELGVSEGAMYDRVTKKLFRNRGTGSFGYGNDVARPVMGLNLYKKFYTAKDYVQDGLVAMWDGIENAGWGQHDSNATSVLNLVNNRGIAASSISDKTFTCVEQNLGYAIVYNSMQQTYEVVGDSCNIFFTLGSHWLPTFEITTSVIRYNNGIFSKTIDTSTCKSVVFCIDRATGEWGIYKNGQFAMGGDDYVETSSIFTYVAKIRPTTKYRAAIYNTILTPAEIAANYKVDKARFNLPEATA